MCGGARRAANKSACVASRVLARTSVSFTFFHEPSDLVCVCIRLMLWWLLFAGCANVECARARTCVRRHCTATRDHHDHDLRSLCDVSARTRAHRSRKIGQLLLEIGHYVCVRDFVKQYDLMQFTEK